MNEIETQVARARRRLLWQRFLSVAPWALLACLGVAAVGAVLPKFWRLEFLYASDDFTTTHWLLAWLGGALALALLVSAAVVWRRRPRALDAAIELDRRFGLKERVTSTLSLSPAEADTESGRALVADARRQIERVDVRERFGVSASWPALLPLAPLGLALALWFSLGDALPPQTAQAGQQPIDVQKRVKEAAQRMQEQLRRQREQLKEDDQLEEAEKLFTKLEASLDKLQGDPKIEREKALIQLNDLKKELEQRRKELGGAEEMRKQLNQLKNLAQGPADKAAKALKEGDFDKAARELKNLQEQLNKGELGEQGQKQLADQLQQMQQKLQDLAEAHEQAKQQLAEQLKKLDQAGDKVGAAQTQRQLEQLKKLDQAMQQARQLADKLDQAAQRLNEGDAQQAARQLQELAQQLEQMQSQGQEAEAIEQLLEQVALCKNAMTCEECEGEGLGEAEAQGRGPGGQKRGKPGFGMGEGQGQGARPEEETATGDYVTKVKGKVKPGEAFVSGEMGGPNRSGQSVETVKAEIAREYTKNADPLTDQRLPRDQRDHAREYFERFREGK